MSSVVHNMFEQGVNNMRVLPYNTEAEQSLLGAIMLNNDIYETVSELLLPIHFATPVNGKIYDAVAKLIAQGQIADPITLRNYFEKNNELSGIGGGKYLIQLVNSVFSMSAAENYAKIIYEMYLRRQLIVLGEKIVNNANKFEIEQDPQKQIETIESELFVLANSGDSSGFEDFGDVLIKAASEVEAAYHSDCSITGITTGFMDLDKQMGGLNKSDLIILAGRPSMGKTALATNIAFNAALASLQNNQSGGKVAFFSLEMSSSQLATRILSQTCEIASEKLRRGEIREEEYKKFLEGANRLKEMPLYIDDTPALSVSSVRTRARRLKRKYGLDVIIIDYLQLLTGSSVKGDNRVQEISEITRSLKAIAKELNVPVIALSQLSRAVEARDDKRPQLADLRESGSIEQDADIVMFVYRDEYYEARREPAIGTDKHIEWMSNMQKMHNLAEIIIAKQRHGPIGTVRLFFDGKYTKFDNLAENRKVGYD